MNFPMSGLKHCNGYRYITVCQTKIRHVIGHPFLLASCRNCRTISGVVLVYVALLCLIKFEHFKMNLLWLELSNVVLGWSHVLDSLTYTFTGGQWTWIC